jgi:hypothetical protein
LKLNPKSANLSTVNDELRKNSFDGDIIQEGFDIYILIRTLADCNPAAMEKIEPYLETIYFEFFKEHTGYIEILVENG